jgi:hypothetical protein
MDWLDRMTPNIKMHTPGETNMVARLLRVVADSGECCFGFVE